MRRCFLAARAGLLAAARPVPGAGPQSQVKAKE